MTILGKIILFLNIPAVIAVVYFAAESWKLKQEENAVALRYYLYLDGLAENAPDYDSKFTDEQKAAYNNDPELGSVGDPDLKKKMLELPIVIGTEENPYPMGPNKNVTTVRMEFIRDHFKDAGKGLFSSNQFPTSRSGELKRVYDKVKTYLAGRSDQQKLDELVGKYTGYRFDPGWLVLLADHFDEREMYRSLIKSPSSSRVIDAKANAATAVAMFEKKFRAAIDPADRSAFDTDTAAVKAKKVVVDNLTKEVDALRTTRQAKFKAFDDLYKASLSTNPPENFKDETNPELKAKGEAIDKAYMELVVAEEALQKKLDERKAAEKQLYDTIAGTTMAAADESERQRRAIQTLMILDSGESWQRRLILVYGLKDYYVALRDRVERPEHFYKNHQQDKRNETVAFERRYELDMNRAIYLDRVYYKQSLHTAALKEQLVVDDAQLAKAKAQNALAVADLAAVNAKLTAGINGTKDIKGQHQMEKELFEIQKQIGELLRMNFELEDKLAEQDRKRLTGGK